MANEKSGRDGINAALIGVFGIAVGALLNGFLDQYSRQSIERDRLASLESILKMEMCEWKRRTAPAHIEKTCGKASSDQPRAYVACLRTWVPKNPMPFTKKHLDEVRNLKSDKAALIAYAYLGGEAVVHHVYAVTGELGEIPDPKTHHIYSNDELAELMENINNFHMLATSASAALGACDIQSGQKQ